MGQPAHRRRYDSSLRRERTAQTRERIGPAAGAGVPAWDWRALTVRAAAERAGVSERTGYRHFPGEREFHDAVMQRLEQEAGVTLEGPCLEDVAEATAWVFAHVSSFPLAPRIALTHADRDGPAAARRGRGLGRRRAALPRAAGPAAQRR